MQPHPTRSIVIAGCPPDTGNLGVSALFESTVTQIADRVPGSRMTVLDHGRGARPALVERSLDPVEFELVGAAPTRRLYQSRSWFQIELAARLGGLGNAAALRFRDALAVLDVSGGDSFTDLYGALRFNVIVRPKTLALRFGVPLVLLPQTFGPFEGRSFRARAERIVRGSAAAWARDARSFHVLRDLLGEAFDESRHQLGVDMAFLLGARSPAMPVPRQIEGWFDDGGLDVFGVNVSGLIHSDPSVARTRYGFRADYDSVIVGLIRELLGGSNSRVVLVPHVITPPGKWRYESDEAACEDLARVVADDRVAVLPARYDQAEIKSIIGRMDWFCGTRMHSTIAALSSGVPTAAIAYSPKTLGVFETCGQGAHVADPRTADTEEVVAALVHSWEARAETRIDLAERLRTVFATGAAQMDQIAQICLDRAEALGR